jgi:hypothetical protein
MTGKPDPAGELSALPSSHKAPEEHLYPLACALQKLNKQPTHLLRLFLLKPVSRPINKMSTAHLRASSTLHPLECAGSLENTPVALSTYE